MYEFQVGSLSIITLLIGKQITGIPGIMVSFGKTFLFLIKVPVGSIQATSYRISFQPMLILVCIMENLHVAFRCWKISNTMEH